MHDARRIKTEQLQPLASRGAGTDSWQTRDHYDERSLCWVAIA